RQAYLVGKINTLGNREDFRTRDTQLAKFFDPFRSSFALQSLFEFGAQLITMLITGRIGGIPFVVGKFRCSQGIDEAPELTVVAHRDNERLIGGSKRTIRRQ